EQWILPARVDGFGAAALDELGALGEIVWIAQRGPGGAGGGEARVALYRRDRVRALADTAALPETAPPLQRALLEHLQARGASFFAQLGHAAAGATSDEILAALWELVWAGLVTNDTFQPLRAQAALRRAGPRPSARLLAAQAAGRWSAVSALTQPAPPDTARAHARALALLDRHGVVSREAADGVAGGFASLLPVLRAMEEAGKIRRGFFVEGLTGAQFALPGAVDRLRAAREPGDEDPPVLALAAVDPANAYGALLPWPAPPAASASKLPAPRRVAGARIVLVGGALAFFVDRGAHSLRLYTDDPAAIAAGTSGLRLCAARRRPGHLRVETIDGTPALRSPWLPALRAAGFRLEPGAIVLDSQPMIASVDR
ncbi:MAG TPA: DEAD/DEAH box helicase, partial [Polyangia bacterium]|nr:DEAD/DEAH box helicase [Polyangia bacterium]